MFAFLHNLSTDEVLYVRRGVVCAGEGVRVSVLGDLLLAHPSSGVVGRRVVNGGREQVSDATQRSSGLLFMQKAVSGPKNARKQTGIRTTPDGVQ